MSGHAIKVVTEPAKDRVGLVIAVRQSLIPNDGDDPPGYINTGFQDHYLAVVYKLRCISFVHIRIGN